MASIKQNKDKNGNITGYRIRACVGRDELDKQIWRTCTIPRPEGFTPKKELNEVKRLAGEWEKAQIDEYKRTGSKVEKSKITVKEFIEKKWIPIYVEDGQKSPNSVTFFKNTSKHIIDFMGDKKLKQVDEELCSKFVAYLNTKATSHKTGKPLSSTSKTHVFGTLRNIFRTARRWKYIPSDPTEELTRYERPHREKKQVEFLTESEAKAFVDALQQEPIMKRTYFTLLLVTGMRRGEAVALQWSDIDDGKKSGTPSITVSKSATADKAQENGRLIKATKTGETRVIPITESTVKMLEDLKKDTELQLGAILMPSAYVFSVDGDPYTCIFPTTPTRWMEGIVKRHDIKKCSVHELRRTFATLALQAKVDPKTVAAITGHADVQTLFKFYTGTDADQKQKAVAGMDSILSRGQTK